MLKIHDTFEGNGLALKPARNIGLLGGIVFYSQIYTLAIDRGEIWHHAPTVLPPRKQAQLPFPWEAESAPRPI
jgi:hypothetical protein